ncbi:MAG TPA: V-type ATP synthase subunit A [Candidatus Marinimicrobia bacterium]|nr:V-type ATP synthase subunit A [Candidatus Neomarinimicrobiota bacterium]
MVKGLITSISGNMISVRFKGSIVQNEVGYVVLGDERLKSEVIKIKSDLAYMQVYELTKGIKVGDPVEFTREMLSVQLGPGVLSRVYDGLQNPLNDLAEAHGFFLPRGVVLDAIDLEKKWTFTPIVKKGDVIYRGMAVGTVPEGIFKHKIMVPFNWYDEYTVESVVKEGDYKVSDEVAVLSDSRGDKHSITMIFDWPVKIPIDAYNQKIVPEKPMTTRIRIVDTFFPVNKGGTYCIPGPFGAGKTVLQQLTSRYADVDIVIIAACGERAGEVVETLREFPKLEDPRTGKTLMERTVIICNTSSMPVAAREASVYTAATIGEYYRQMGLDVLILADSTSRWAQAMREVSGRLEEIPGEEAFPAYLESRIAEFYERAGYVELPDGTYGSMTIGGTVSPAGGNFEEPVTQATLKVLGALHGLSRARSDARRYPAIDPLDSWSKYEGVIPTERVQEAHNVLRKGNDVHQMMMVVGEEGTSLEDFVVYLKGELLDSVYLQQDGFDPVAASCDSERQEYTFKIIYDILFDTFSFNNKEEARKFFNALRQLIVDWNYIPMEDDKFKEQEKLIEKHLKSALAEKAVA